MWTWLRRDPAKGWVLVALGSAAFFWLILTVKLLPRATEYETALGRATARSTGMVTDVSSADGTPQITVQWRDDAGAMHRSTFHLRSGDEYGTGDRFLIRYEPDDPSASFADAGESVSTAGSNARGAHTIGTVSLGLLVLLWLTRCVMWQHASRQPAVLGRATPLRGDSVGVIGSSWLILGPGTDTLRYDVSMDLEELPEHDSVRFQRFMWHPALDALPPDAEVYIHGDTSRARRVHVQLPDGTALRPAGRLRRSPPRAVVLLPRSERPDRKRRALLPLGTVAFIAIAGAVLGRLDDVAYVVPACVAGILNAWAWTGGDPT